MFTNLILNKYVLSIVVLVGVLGGIFYYGYHSASVRDAQAQQQLEADERLQTVLIQQRDEQHAEVKIQEVTKIKTVIQKVNNDVEKIVERPIYHNVCLDNDGLLRANEALTSGDTPVGTTGAVPSPDSPK